MYSKTFNELQNFSFNLRQVDSEVDLYWEMALSMYKEIEKNNEKNQPTVMILPVGPVFQYRKFNRLLEEKPLDLRNVHIFFMDEYLDENDKCICADSPLSFHGFVQRELLDRMDKKHKQELVNVHFPAPDKPEEYDRMIEDLGGITLCHAGVGIVGHLAFNEPIDSNKMTVEEYTKLGTRKLNLTEKTITINSHTAMSGAYELIPKRAITVGFRQIYEAKKIEIYMNRDWQSTVLRKALLMNPTTEFPVTILQTRGNVSFTVTPNVAKCPDFALR